MEEKKSGLPTIIGLIALILVLFVGVKLVFAGMGMVSGRNGDTSSGSATQMGQSDLEQSQTEQEQQAQGQQQDQPAPAFCPYCGEGLFDGFQWGQFCPYCGEQLTLGEAKE